MKRFAMAIALACVLSGTSFAGEIPTGDYVPPPPPGSNRSKATFPERTVTTLGYGTPDSEQASLDPLQSLMLTILSLLAR
jgi:hypothetical protein